MNSAQVLFIIMVIVLGAFVLLSYILGYKRAGNVEILWGGVPEKYKKVYNISILTSAVMFIIFTTYLITQISDSDSTILFVTYALLLLASTLWMPFVLFYQQRKTLIIWFLVRGSLFLTAIASLMLVMLVSANTPVTVFDYLALVSVVIFTLHTGVLDAILWPYFYNQK